MATRLRRSLAQRGGRTGAALLALVIAGQGGLDLTATAAPHLLAAASPAVAERPVVRSSRTSALDAPIAVSAVAHLGPAGTDPADGTDPSATAGLEPSIQYEEAARHEGDRPAFTPGGRVTVGFLPRPGDTWAVGGGSPHALPAGRLDGRTMRLQGVAAIPERALRTDGQAVRPEPDLTDDPSVDLPAGISNPLAAVNASYRATVPDQDPAVAPEAAVSSKGLRREIFGFLPYWEVNSSSLRLDYAKISTIAYFGVGADSKGNLQKRNSNGSTTVGWSGWTSSRMTSIISAAHSHHTRVVLTVQSFAWNATGLARQKALLGSSTARVRLARQIAAAVRDRGADGVNLDFEPLASTYDAEFTALVRSIRTELNRIHKGYQITFDTTGSIGNYPIAKATAAGGADAVFVMGYDYRTAGSSPVGSVAPVGRTGYDIRDTIAAYTAKIAPSKVILGVPYYGRAWSTTSSRVHAGNTSGTKTGASTTVVYDTAADYLAKYGRRYESTEQVAWTAYQRKNCTATYGCVTSWRQLYVDDAAAISAKYDLVNSYGLRGAGIWALGYDGTRPELWAAIQRKFITDSTAPKAGVKTLASRQANPAFTVTWTGRDDVGIASYDVQVASDGGSWHAWLTGTKATSATWRGFDGHDYAFRVRAHDAKGHVSPWNVTAKAAAAGSGLKVGGFGRVRINGLSARSAADTSASRVHTYDAGDLVAIVGGPKTADGHVWYRVVGPLSEWAAVRPTSAAAWVATGGSGSTWLSPNKAPNATRVAAALGDLAFGNGGGASVGTTAAAAAHRAFSPNGDGSRDSLVVDWTNDRAFTSISLRVFKANGTLVGNVPVKGLSAGHHEVRWNGKVGGTRVANGRYLVVLVGVAGGARFANPAGSFSAAALARYGVTVDTTRPTVTAASINSALLSPNGDGTRDTVKATLTASGATAWLVTVAPLSGTKVGATVASGSGKGGKASITWNGHSNAGRIVADGTYRLTLTAVDDAGNKAARAWTVRVDTTAPAVSPATSPAVFSPNGDGAADASTLTWSASERITGTTRIYRGSTLVRSWTVSNAAAGSIRWTGTNASGAKVADGRYSFRVTGHDAAGNRTVRAATVVVDRTLSTLRWSRSSFYPQDADAITPTARLSFRVKRSAVVSLGIYSGSTLVRAIWTNRSVAAGSYDWTWHGRNTAGAFVAPGTYVVRVTARSPYGTTVLTRTIVVDAFTTTLSSTSLKAGQTLTVTFTTTEKLGATPKVSFTQRGKAAVTRTATSLGSGRYRVSFKVASGGTGTATLRITGRDTSGGTNSTTRKVTIR